MLLLALLLAADPHPGHRLLAADRSTGKMLIVAADGRTEWEFPNKHDVHDLHLLPTGNLLTHTSHTTVVELAPDKSVVWKYEAKPKPGYTGRVEVHAFERLPDGTTMVAESGNARIVHVNKAGEVVKEVPLTVKRPNSHADTRMVRCLPGGGYLVCHEADGCVREYDAAGTVVWEYALQLGDRKPAGGHGPEAYGTSVYGAVRLPSGNTLIAGGNNHRVLEVTPDKKVVWSIDQKELPGITLAWVTGLHALPNGNVVIGNCHAGPDQPQLIEVTRDKKVVWTFKDWKRFGDNLASAQILDVPGVVR
jgi:hypothetical protein